MSDKESIVFHETFDITLAYDKNKANVSEEVLFLLLIQKSHRNVTCLKDSSISQSLLHGTLTDENIKIKLETPVEWKTTKGKFSMMKKVVE